MTYESWYRSIHARLEITSWPSVLRIADSVLVATIAVAYCALIAFLALQGDLRVLKVVLVPAATFAIISVIRLVVNEPRPYESHDISPLIPRDSKGRSFPSRHVASALIIGCAFTWIWVPLGVVVFCASIALSAIRVLGGVHYVHDVIASFAIALACGYLGFALIP